MNAKQTQKELKKVDRDVKSLDRKLKRVRISGRRKRKSGKRKRARLANMSNIGGVNAVVSRTLGYNSSTLRNMHMFAKHMKNQYIMGLVHPDEAVMRGIPLKLPSDIPIPTASIGWHEQYTFSTSSVGSFLLGWRPNYFCTANALTDIGCTQWSNMTFNNASTLTGNTTTNGNYFVAKTFTPAIGIQRYRLVSALMKVQYNGSVLSQAGTFISCVAFDAFRCATGNTTTPVTVVTDPQLDRFGNFSIISNGTWNQTTDVTSNAHGLEALYVPMDPLDVVFDYTNAYYGFRPTTASSVSPGLEGAPQTYIFAGRNLPASTSCILVDVYYNFELIPDVEIAPILRSSSADVPSKQEGREVGDSLNALFQKRGLISKIQEMDKESIWNSVLNLGVKYIPKLLAAL